MPLYEYKCGKCGARCELLRRMSDADVDVVCPECRAGSARRLLSTFATAGCGANSRFT